MEIELRCQANQSFLFSFSMSLFPLLFLYFCPRCYRKSNFLRKFMKVKVAESCPTLCNPMDYTVHGILQGRILERVAFPFSRGSSQPRNWTRVSCIAGGRFISWAIVQFSSVAQSCLTLCDPMNHSMPGLPVHHQLSESTQTHVHWVSDAIQPSHPLSSPFPPALNLSQHQGFFKWVSSLHQVAKVLEFQFQH